MRQQEYLLTICIPTFNRPKITCQLIQKLPFHHLVQYLIIDDGSKESAFQELKTFLAKNKYAVELLRKKNGGKLAAIRYALDYAKGTFFINLDSDDLITQASLNRILAANQRVLNKRLAGELDLIGCCGHCVNKNDQIIGSLFPNAPLICNYLKMRFDYKTKGDKAESILTTVLQKMPVKLFEGEKETSNGIQWVLSSTSNFLFVNQTFIIKNIYQPQVNITGKRLYHITLNKNSSRNYFKEILIKSFTFNNFQHKIEALFQYTRFSWHGTQPFLEKEIIQKYSLLLFFILPFGYLMSIWDNIRLAKQNDRKKL